MSKIKSQTIWIKNPLATFADDTSNVDGGIVVRDGVIIQLVASGGVRLRAEVDTIFDASRHVVLPGLINTHHHMYQTLTRAHRDAINKELFDWLKALYPVWANVVNRDSFRLATRLALTELLDERVHDRI